MFITIYSLEPVVNYKGGGKKMLMNIHIQY